MKVIEHAKSEHAKWCSVCDGQIRGAVVQEVRWDNQSLILQLSISSYLNVCAKADHIECNLGRDSAQLDELSSMIDRVLLVFEDYQYEWCRGDLSQFLVGQAIKGIWHGRTSMWVHFQKTTVECSLIYDCESDEPCLLWEESD